MKKLAHLLIVILAIAGATSCSEDQDCEEGVIQVPNAVATVDGTSYQAALTDCRLPKIQSFTIQGAEGGQITGASGTVITIFPQSLVDSNGELIDGLVSVDLLEFYNNGEIVACQLSTNTLNDASSIEPTLAKGLVHLNITFNSEQVTPLETIQVFMPSDNITETFFQFNSPSCPEVVCRVLWERNINTEVVGTTIDNPDGTLSNGYLTFIQNLGWISIAQFNQAADRTTVYNKASPGYNTTNSDVFLVYDSIDIGVGLLTSYNQTLEVFDETFGEIPLGQQATFVFTSRDSQYQFSTNSRVITQDIIGVTTGLSAASEQELVDAINSL